jgi:peptidyl-dipeptidase Dcp
MTENPFFEAWNTPFELPPFDRIRPEHFPSAFDRGMAEHIAEIEGIAKSPEAPGFANTVEALERSGRLLRRVSRVFNNLTSSATNPALDAIDRDYAPKLAAHRSRIMLDAGLFARIDALWHERDRLGLMPDQRRLLERHHLNFVRAGVAAVDVIDLDNPTWHTAQDDLEHVSQKSLQVVGDVILAALPEIEKRVLK